MKKEKTKALRTTIQLFNLSTIQTIVGWAYLPNNKGDNKKLTVSTLPPTGEGAVVGEFMSRTNADEGTSCKGKMSYHPLTRKSNIRIKLLFDHIDFLPSPVGRGKESNNRKLTMSAERQVLPC